MALMISEAVNRYAAGCLASGFSLNSNQTPKKSIFRLAWNGERAGNLLRNCETLPAQPENPLSARSGRGWCTNGTEDGTDVKVTYELKEWCKSDVKVMYELKERCNSVVRKNYPFMPAWTIQWETLFLSRSPLNLRKSPAMVDYFSNSKWSYT